jgi:hypothetical protein
MWSSVGLATTRSEASTVTMYSEAAEATISPMAVAGPTDARQSAKAPANPDREGGWVFHGSGDAGTIGDWVAAPSELTGRGHAYLLA